MSSGLPQVTAATPNSPSSKPRVAIVSVNYNQTPLTADMLDSLESAGLPAWCEVFVVDNASREDGSAELKARFPWVHTLRSNINLGFAGGNNLALPHITADFVFLLNNDALIEPGTLEAMLARFDEEPRLGALSPVVYDYPQRGDQPTIQYAGASRVSTLTGRNNMLFRGQAAGAQHSGLQDTPYCHGAAMLVRCEALEAAGPMDEDYFLYYEELDWSNRIREAGYKVMLDGDAHIWHRESVSTGADSAFKVYWINRSRIRYMRRNKSTLASSAFQAFYLLAVLPLHGTRHFLAGRREHARALWRAWREQGTDPLAPVVR